MTVDTNHLNHMHRLESLLLALVADLPGLLLTVHGVAVLLRLLRASLHFKLADLLGLIVTILLLDRNTMLENFSQRNTPVYVSLALHNLNLEQKQDFI